MSEENTLTEPEMLTMALALSKIHVNEKTSTLICMLLKGIKNKGDQFSIKDIAEIQTMVETLYNSEP